MKDNIRYPYVSGMFYPSDEDHIRSFYGSIDHKGKKNARCSIIPHAGWQYSGETAIKTIKNTKKADTVIIIGPNHRAFGKQVSVYDSNYKWLLPNGLLSIDEGINNDLIKKGFTSSNQAHDSEHSIEVIMPLLIEEFGENIKFVPISIIDNSKNTLDWCYEIIYDVYGEQSKKITLIASSDFSHFLDFESARKLDQKAIECILELDYNAFYNAVRQNDISICGMGPIYIILRFASILGLKPELIEYTSSGRTTGDYSEVVAYAGIVFRE